MVLGSKEGGIPSRFSKKSIMLEVVSGNSTLRIIYLLLKIFRMDTFLLRTFAYTTARVWSFLYFYDKVNKDPRRVARPDYMALAGLGGGIIAGVVTNPIDIVFAR